VGGLGVGGVGVGAWFSGQKHTTPNPQSPIPIENIKEYKLNNKI